MHLMWVTALPLAALAAPALWAVARDRCERRRRRRVRVLVLNDLEPYLDQAAETLREAGVPVACFIPLMASGPALDMTLAQSG
jgi:sirohydrochlorin ferrochelatase